MKRYAKLVAVEKEKITKAGYGVPPLSDKKRVAALADVEEGTPTKKGKKTNTKDAVAELDDDDTGEMLKDEIKREEARV